MTMNDVLHGKRIQRRSQGILHTTETAGQPSTVSNIGRPNPLQSSLASTRLAFSSVARQYAWINIIAQDAAISLLKVHGFVSAHGTVMVTFAL
jgi:hypothetical protein